MTERRIQDDKLDAPGVPAGEGIDMADVADDMQAEPGEKVNRTDPAGEDDDRRAGRA